MDADEQKAFNDLKVKAEGLENQVKVMVKPEDYQKIADELKGIKDAQAAATKAAEDAAKVKAEADRVAKEAVLATKRFDLVKRGLPEDKVKVMTEEGITVAELALSTRKPGADMGGGSGGSSLEGVSLFELGKLAYTKK